MRRVRGFVVPFAELAKLFSDVPVRIVSEKPLPEIASVVAFHIDRYRDGLVVNIESDEFDSLPDGHRVPTGEVLRVEYLEALDDEDDDDAEVMDLLMEPLVQAAIRQVYIDRGCPQPAGSGDVQQEAE